MSSTELILSQFFLIIFIGVYLILSKGKGHLKFNRIYLLITPLLALTLPFLSRIESNSSNQVFSIQLNEVIIQSEKMVQEAASEFQLNWILILGCIISFSLFVYHLTKLLKKPDSEKYKTVEGYSVYLLKNDIPTHSFFNSIYINEKHIENEYPIIEHEIAHCKEMHTWDNILMAVYKAIFWFNPAIYLINKYSKENHEFLADNYVVEGNSISRKEYGELLIQENFNFCIPILGNEFAHKSTLRKRIIKLKYKNQYKMKHLLIIPVVAGLTIASMSFTTIPNSQTSKISNLITTTGDPEVKPEYPGGMDALIKFMTTEVKFPKNLEKENIEGKVFVKFQVNEKGEVENISIAKSSGHDEFDNEAKRVVAKMPNWNPAKKDGKNVSAEMTLPFTFQLAD